MSEYLTNAIRTPDGTILQSFNRHDYKTHLDKNGLEYMVDGGREYLRRNVHDGFDYEELSIPLPQPHQVVREHLYWGTYGKSGKEPLQYILLKDMETDHIQKILELRRVDPFYKKSFEEELECRKCIT